MVGVCRFQEGLAEVSETSTGAWDISDASPALFFTVTDMHKFLPELECLLFSTAQLVSHCLINYCPKRPRNHNSIIPSSFPYPG